MAFNNSSVGEGFEMPVKKIAWKFLYLTIFVKSILDISVPPGMASWLAEQTCAVKNSCHCHGHHSFASSEDTEPLKSPAEGACCPLPMSPLQSWLISATEVLITHLWNDLGWRRPQGVPFLKEGPGSYSGQCQPWIQSSLHRKGIPWGWQHSVSQTSLRRATASFWGGRRNGHFCSSFYSMLFYSMSFYCTVGPKAAFHFPHSSAPQNLHQWERTAEEEEIARKALGASSPE